MATRFDENAGGSKPEKAPKIVWSQSYLGPIASYKGLKIKIEDSLEEESVNVSFVAGFGPIVRDVEASHSFWADRLGIPFEEAAPNYWADDGLEGVKAFALWPLSQAAQSCFGVDAWPEGEVAPQAWLELDVQTRAEVTEAASELEAGGYRLLRGAHEEPWGQTTARLFSPEGPLVGITYTPWMHSESKASGVN